MFRVINLCEDSDDNEEWPKRNTNAVAPSISSILVARKRPRDERESSSNHAHHPSDKNDPGNTPATGSPDFVVDLKLADEVEVSISEQKRMRCDNVNNKQGAKNDAAGKYGRILKGVEATEKDVGIEDAQIEYHRESHEGLIAAAAASQQMNSDSGQTSHSGQTSQDDESKNEYSQKPSNSVPPSKESGRQSKVSPWEVCFSELADYRKLQGHCNVPASYSENAKLAAWVANQRRQYKSHQEGKTSPMTSLRIQALESLGFEWNCFDATWEVRLSELNDYRKIHGHCSVPTRYSENAKLGKWVNTQRNHYKSQQEGKTSPMTNPRIQALERLGFEWDRRRAAWEDRLSELADYRKIHGHCNVPTRCSENAMLGAWVGTQRNQYKMHLDGKTSSMTPSRLQALEEIGFEWNCVGAIWDDRLSELADYRKIHGHCNVPAIYSENTKLGAWVRTQRSQYKLHQEGKTSRMTNLRIQELESIGFEWKLSRGHRKRSPKKSIVDDDPTRVRERVVEAPERVPTAAQTQKDFSGREHPSNQIDVVYEAEESDWNDEVHFGYIPGRTEEI
jgi:hypothetical protein